MRKFEVVDDEFRKHKDVEIKIPKRGTKTSACYDFYTPVAIDVKAYGRTTIIPMDIKASMYDDEVLLLFVRSSIGIKKGLVLANGTGIIDSDFYSSKDTDGNICAMFINTTDKDIHIEAGERVMQGMFTRFLTVENEYIDILEERAGGIGSSGTK